MRMNISVADDLKKRMDKVDSVNWSAVACAAFMEIVNTRENERIGPNMQRIIERLRLSSNKKDDRETRAGRDEGRKWAGGYATVDQLERLAKARNATHDWYFGVGSSAYCAAEQFYFIIAPDRKGDRNAATEFWREPVTNVSNEYVQGFAEGMCDLWAEVRDKL